MFNAVIDTESLKDPRLINNFQISKVKVEYEPNSEVNKYHHVFFVKINPELLNQKIKALAQEIKNGWYAFFWNDQELLIVFNKKSFKVLLDNPDYSEAQSYGRSVGIQEEFLDLKNYFERYKKIAQ